MNNDADSLRDRNRELEILTVIAAAMNRPVGLEESLGVALARVSELLGLHTGWLYLFNEESDQPYLAASRNLPPGLASNPRVMSGSCYCLDALRAGGLAGAANINVVGCSRLAELMGQGSGGLRFHSSIPLESGGRKLGVLNVAAADWRELTEAELRLLRAMGDMLSLAIERARLAAIAQRLGVIEERNRLAGEIHDAMARELAALVRRLEALEALLSAEPGTEPERLRDELERTTADARASLAEVRRSTIDLRGAALEGRTIAAALEELAARTERESELEITFEVRGAQWRPSARVELGLYRIAQQALSILLGCGASRNVAIVLSMSSTRARLTIDDDGRGFDAGGEVSTQLVAIAERARLIGGRLELADTPGAGTRIVVSVPLEPTD